MKKLITLGLVSYLALASFASANTQFENRDLGIREYQVQESVNNSTHPDDNDLGIGDHKERT